MKTLELLQSLADANVQYVLVGGLAIQLHGFMRATFDIDLVLAMDACASTAHTEAGNPVTIYRLTATACNQPAAGACPNPAPGVDYVERLVQAAVEL